MLLVFCYSLREFWQGVTRCNTCQLRWELFSGEFYNTVLEFCIQNVYRWEEIPFLNEDFTLPFLCSYIYLDAPPPHPVKSSVIGWHPVLSRFHPRVQRSNIIARKQRAVSSLSSNCLKFSLSLSGKTSQKKSRKSITIRLFDANNISARSYVSCPASLPAVWLQHYFTTRKSLKTAGNVAGDNLRIFTRLLPKFDNNTWLSVWLCFLFRTVSLQRLDTEFYIAGRNSTRLTYSAWLFNI